MAKVTYAIVEHDGGWAYKVGRHLSRRPSRPARRRTSPPAGRRSSSRCRARPPTISWEDERGRWHAEIARGGDRPEVEVED